MIILAISASVGRTRSVRRMANHTSHTAYRTRKGHHHQSKPTNWQDSCDKRVRPTRATSYGVKVVTY
jgi:hypothetical protein